MKNRPKPWTEEEINTLLEMKKQGCTYAKISACIGRSVMCCSSMVYKLREDEKRRAATVKVAAEIQTLIDELKTDKEIREKLGLSVGEYQSLKALHNLRRTREQIAMKSRIANNLQGVNHAENKTICWTCKNVAVNCKKPVKGWKAKKIPYKSASGQDLPCWLVSKCPNYDPEPYAKRKGAKK